ncbi:hypothetical protein [Vreelandella sp. EE7]
MHTTTTADEMKLLAHVANPGKEHLTKNDFAILPDELFDWGPKKLDQVATDLHDKRMIAYYGPTICARLFKTTKQLDDLAPVKQAKLRLAGANKLNLSMHHRPSVAD